MPLSDDQKAMLRLLAQREQGYEDLAALMGLSVEQVRAKVKDALEQLEEEGEAPPPVPAESPPAEEPPVAEPAPKPVEATPPPPAKPPEPPAPAKPPPRPAGGSAPRRPKPALPKSGGARAALAAGLAVVVALVIVLAVSGGGDSGDTTTAASEKSGTAAEGTTNTAAAGSKEITQAILTAVDGSDAKGLAVFGRVKKALALQIEATGLAPTAKGQSYTIWLAQSPQRMLPLATTAVGKSGKIASQVAVPTEVLAYLAKGTFDQIDVSLTDTATLKAALNKATSEKRAPLYTGTDVLRGTVTGPIVGAAKK